MTIRLVLQDPVFATVQGEGSLVGTPSVFVRTWGCDYTCSWCDSKNTWQSGSGQAEWAVEDVVDQVRSHKFQHAVITGGNPVLQGDETLDLLCSLQQEWAEGKGWRPPMHVTLETQASIYDEALARLADLSSLSPKLHQWNDEVLYQWIQTALEGERKVQVKIVCTDAEEVGRAIEEFKDLFTYFSTFKYPLPEFFLQPEFSLGRQGVQMVRLVLEKAMRSTELGLRFPHIRVLGQVHKNHLFVK